MTRFAITSNDEQRIVDSDSEADHHPEGGGEVRHGQEVRHQRDHENSGSDAAERRADGQPHGQHGTKSKNQDHDCEGQAEHLGGWSFELREHLTAVLDLRARNVGLDRLHLHEYLGELLGRIQVRGKRHRGKGDVATRRHLTSTVRRERAHHTHVVTGIKLGKECVQRIALGCGEPSLGAHHDGAAAPALLGTESVGQQRETFGTLHVGKRELSGETAPERTHGDTECDE